MLASSLPPSCFDAYSLSTSSLRCNALFWVISFLVLRSICLNSSWVHFKKRPEYLTRETAQVFIALIKYLLHSFVSSSFLVLLRYPSLIFSFISSCLMVSAFKMPKYLYASFSPIVQILSWFWSFYYIRQVSLPLFITCMAQFYTPNSISMSWLYILTVRIKVSSSFSFLANSLMSSIIIIIIILLWEFFTPASADGLSLEFERQQVSTSLQDSSRYSVWF